MAAGGRFEAGGGSVDKCWTNGPVVQIECLRDTAVVTLVDYPRSSRLTSLLKNYTTQDLSPEHLRLGSPLPEQVLAVNNVPDVAPGERTRLRGRWLCLSH